MNERRDLNKHKYGAQALLKRIKREIVLVRLSSLDNETENNQVLGKMEKKQLKMIVFTFLLYESSDKLLQVLLKVSIVLKITKQTFKVSLFCGIDRCSLL